jgi:hypothetical protein
MTPEPSPHRPSFPEPVSWAEQEAETDEAWPAVGIGPITASQAKGALLFGVLGAVAGLIVGVALSAIPISGLTWAARLALFGGIGALAGATAGFIYGGGRESELEEDAGNQIGPPPLRGEIRDPEPARQAVDELRHRTEGSP